MRTTTKIAFTIVVIAAIAYVIYMAYSPKSPTNEPRGQTPVLPASTQNGSTTTKVEVVVIKESATTSPSVNVEYPQFSELPMEFNSMISAATLDRLAEFRKNAAENEIARKATARPGDVLPPAGYSFISTWQPAQVNSRYISFIIRYDSYTGGANENQELETFNYDVKAGRLMGLNDLFATTTDYLKKISDLARQQLQSSMGAASDGNAPIAMIEAGTEPVAENFANFTFTDDVVTIYFPKYAVGPGAFGEQKAGILRSSIK